VTRVAACALLAILFAVLPAGAKEPGWLDRVFSDGEILEFSLTWLRMAGGHATMSITPAGDTWRIESRASSNAVFDTIYRVRDEITSIVDRATFSTLSYEKKLLERRRSKHSVTTIDTTRHVATHEGKEIAVEPVVYDPLSVVYHLRRLELVPGERILLTLVEDGRTYPIAVEVLRRETLSTPAGVFRTIVVEPRMQTGVFRDGEADLVIWYSDDELRLPLRIRSKLRAGTITATLLRFSLAEPAAAGSARGR
jgi:hypothetical protein